MQTTIDTTICQAIEVVRRLKTAPTPTDQHASDQLFGQIYTHYYRFVYARVKMRIGQLGVHEDVQEIVDDVFFEIWDRIGEFR